MEKFDLMVNRQIALYLSAIDKLKYIALVSKRWHKIVYSGFGW